MTTAAVAEDRSPWLVAFEERAAAPRREPERLARLRRQAIARFAELGFPSMRQEDWRFTNVGALARTRFALAAPGAVVREEQILPFTFEGMPRLVFVDGHFAPQLSRLEGLPERLHVGSLAAALADGSDAVVDHLGAHASFAEQPFVALNTALFADGACVHAPRGVVAERPLQLLYVASGPGDGEPRMNAPRTLIVAEEASQLTVVESYGTVGGGTTFTCPVTEVVAGEAAVVDHYRLSQESFAAYHVALQQFRCERAAHLSSHSILTGGLLVRNDVRAVLAGEGVDAILNGLYLTKERQHVDTHMWVEHAAPHCDSHELYKGILEGRSRAVFNGLIHVHKGAQKTDAKQTNRNLLLSPEALVNTNPQLLIFADDVKCTHGSTVGQLDQEAVFYLRSRGIGEEAARSLLTYAFARDIVDRVKVESVRRDLEEFLFHRLPKGEVVRQAI
ncbi:MAG TPA: Fe-S cluster assembly protein SufD [Thermoanaerobaculia bacterium]|nr:Fe-S cluster assembly protein SufD [Thermoanaerobaculia bacterium]